MVMYARKAEDLKDKTPGERLKYVRKELLKLTRKAFTDKYDLPEDTLKSWENSRSRLTEKGLKRCIKIYRDAGVNVSEEWILTGEGLDPTISVDLSYYLREPGATYENGAINDEMLLLRAIDSFKQAVPGAVVFLVSEEDMLPFYAPGDYVAGRFKFGGTILDAVGKDCIVELQTGERLLRRLVRNATDDGYNLVCLNPKWGKTAEPVMFNADISCVAPVTWHRRADT